MKLLEMKHYPNVTIAVPTPAASLFIEITEDEFGKPIRIFINAGKCGTEMAAQASALSELATLILDKDDGFNELLTHLSGITTSSVKTDSNGIKVRSVPEGLYLALVKYKQLKYSELEDTLGTPEVKQTVFNYRND
jgi:hypothetical protein